MLSQLSLLDPIVSQALPDLLTISYGELLDPDVYRWQNVSFADNDYQTLGNNVLTITPNGRALSGADITIALSGIPGVSSDPARAGFTRDDFGLEPPAPSLFGIGGPHSQVCVVVRRDHGPQYD